MPKLRYVIIEKLRDIDWWLAQQYDATVEDVLRIRHKIEDAYDLSRVYATVFYEHAERRTKDMYVHLSWFLARDAKEFIPPAAAAAKAELHEKLSTRAETYKEKISVAREQGAALSLKYFARAQELARQHAKLAYARIQEFYASITPVSHQKLAGASLFGALLLLAYLAPSATDGASPGIARQFASDLRLMTQQISFIDSADAALPLSSPDDDAFSPEELAGLTESYVQSSINPAKNAAFLADNSKPSQKVLIIEKGHTLAKLLTTAGVDKKEAQEAITILGKDYNLKNLKIGQEVFIEQGADKSLNILKLRTSIEREIKLTKQADGKFKSEQISREFTPSLRYASATVSNSISAAGRKAGIPVGIMNEMIRALSYDVDFQRDVHPGDRFEVVYEVMEDEDGNIAKSNGIVYVSLNYGKSDSIVYRYKPSDESTPDYFDENGKSIRKALLRTPVDGARITSTFGVRRHPLLGYSKMHEGVDFGAPIGTPILAAGDGVIVQKGWNGGYGHYIEIRHNGEYETAYAHMSKYRANLRVGQRVRQGEVIGYVGSTGLSTGAHLHYEVHRGNRKVNPLGIKFATGRQLAAKELKKFKEARIEADKKVAALREANKSKAVAAKQ